MSEFISFLSPLVKSSDILKKEVVFIVYEPNVPDLHGEWVSEETLRKAASNFNENLNKGTVVPNLFHSKDEEGEYEKASEFTIIKTWINECDCSIGEEIVKEGVWLAKIRFENDFLWSQFLAGEVSGLSLGGKGTILEPTGDSE